jgi:hypothetical protein
MKLLIDVGGLPRKIDCLNTKITPRRQLRLSQDQRRAS